MSFRRRITLGLLAIAFGVVATYATAWAAVWWGPIGKVTTTNAQVSVNGWIDEALKWPQPIGGPFTRPTDVTTIQSWGLRVWEGFNYNNGLLVVDETQADIARLNGLNPIVVDNPEGLLADLTQTANFSEVRAGWPLACVRYHHWSVSTPGGFSESVVRGAWWRNSAHKGWFVFRGHDSEVFPIRPHWPLLMANVAAWGLAFAAAWTGLAWLFRGRRIARRRRRGLCVACGYDLTGLAASGACPECGTGVGAAA